KAVASEVDARFLTISGPEIMSKFYGESEAKLRAVWAEAARHAPSIIFLDEIDSIAPKRSEVHGEVERRVVAQLLALMDGLKARGRIVVIAATNIPDALDPALRRGGRFDREIEIGIPDRKGRLEILRVHTRGVPLADDVDLEAYANQTHGFVGADIALFVKEAAMHALRKRVIPKIRPDDGIPAGLLEGLRVTREDFDAAAKHVEPSAMREVLVEIPDVGWDAIGGLEDAKREIAKAVAWPLQYPDAFAVLHMKPPKGILLVGPPGTGKTLIAKATAAKSGLNFISIKGPEILSKGVGDSEKHIREAFRKARQSAPAILFFDEIDAIVQKRGSGTDLSRVTESVLSQLLTELDGIEELKDVVVLAATNRPDVLDPAILRPGRLEKHIAIPPPDEAARKQIFSIYLREVRDALASDVNVDELVRRTPLFVGADIEALVREAKMAAMEELVASANRSAAPQSGKTGPVIAKRHFDAAFRQVKGTLDSAALEQFERASWEVLYEKEQRDVLVHAAELLLSADALAKKREIPKEIRAMAADLRGKVYWQKKSFDQIAGASQRLAQALGSLLQKR
ncbi:MAG: AAA family ATPase, partial [Methanobacteriota archaeon]